jgi:pyruvate dehydrogenase kinase 2/3/4
MAATIEHPNPKCLRQMDEHSSCCGDENRDHNNDIDDDDVVDDDDDDDDESLITKSHCPIFVHVQETQQTIEIQILDQGGGLSRNKSVNGLFEFAQCPKKYDRLDDQQTYAMVRSPMRGLGVGLSMSKLQMTQFGGDIELLDRSRLEKDEDVYVRVDDKAYKLESGMTATIVLSKDTTVTTTNQKQL